MIYLNIYSNVCGDFNLDTLNETTEVLVIRTSSIPTDYTSAMIVQQECGQLPQNE